MLNPKFAIIAAIVDLLGMLGYARDTFKGVTQPNRVSWLLWTIAPSISFAAQIQSGVRWSALLTFVAALGPFIILIVSFRDKQAYWKISRFDWACGALSALAIILWIVTRTGMVALILSILADFLASVPTIFKAYKAPHTESSNAFLFGIFGSLLTLPTIQTWNFASLGFPLYLLVDCLIIFLLVKFPKLRFTTTKI